MSDVNKKMAKGAAWMVLFKIFERSIGLVSTIILARLLVPADYGLVALAMAIISVLEVLGAFSFDVILIQKQQADRSQYDTAWTFNVIVGVVSAIALAFLARPVAVFYADSRLEWIIYALALAPLASGFDNIGVVAFRKNMEFHKEFKFLVAKKIVAFAVTLAVALLFRNYWALIVGTITSRFAGVALSYISQSYRPRFSLVQRKELFHFSKWLFLNNLILFINNKSADFIVGKIGGSHSLGVFSVAYEISNLPTTELVSPINRAVFPGYARMSHDLSALRQGYLNVLSLASLFVVPMGLGVAATAPWFVPLLLGEKWLDAIPLMQILACYGIIQALQSNTGSIYLAQGKPRTIAYLVLIFNAMLVPSLIFGVARYGAQGAAFALLICAAIVFPINMIVLFQTLRLRALSFVSVIWRPLSAGALMVAIVKFFPSADPSAPWWILILQLLMVIVSGAAAYSAVIFFSWKACGYPAGAEAIILDRVKQKISRNVSKVDNI